jgi:hypothetical protein
VRQEITCWQVMADYYSVLSSAVTKLETNVESARRALYDRARRAVMARMRAMNPPVSDDDINAELAALEAAIARVEGNIARPVEEVLHAHRPASYAAPHRPPAWAFCGALRDGSMRRSPHLRRAHRVASHRQLVLSPMWPPSAGHPPGCGRALLRWWCCWSLGASATPIG